ncbi:LuxR family transcriptional regulator [Streptomyces sp. NL15-2K]|uniref:helix-turn-helix transcriptional regulator n=1 Tax=Streptomyces sp. NL15-2K TaxID=376149 RepID=UPI000F582E51|nr:MULTISPECIES: LuxR family transcriptional regulator [Actinomycetes]WKX14201.1 AAA family ATPase [Kutzneria buriramensis]GCB44639.1 regulatory protein [Streptomyces sp. NL15-2K]
MGRQEQIAGCTTALAECQAGSGRLLTITGPLASGKTTLLCTFAEQAAAAGFHVLRGTGARTERDLPLGLVNQFCDDLPFTIDQAVKVKLVHAVHGSSTLHGLGSMVHGWLLESMLHDASAALMTAGERTPVLIAVDDLHHADSLSMYCLLYLARRIRTARILVAVTGSDLVQPTDPRLYAELMELASGNELTLPLFSRDEVRELLAEALGEQPAGTLVDACMRASGGNPLLTRELIADLGNTGGPPGLDRDGHVLLGRAYTSAIRRCVERVDPVIRRVLEAGALFDKGPPAGPLTLARLAEVDTAAASRALSGLQSAGLVSDGWIPHPRARQTVLDQLPSSALTDLHVRAARLLYEEGSAPLPVALHLLAAGRTPDWAGPVLDAAAEGLLATGDSELAVRVLRLAHDGAADDAERVAFKVALLRAEWRTSPAWAGHRLGQLVAAARGGRLSVTALVTTAHCLLWLGRTAEAVEVIDGLAALDADEKESAEIRFLTVWARFSHPGLLGEEPVDPRAPRRRAEGAASVWDALAYALETTMVKGPNSAAVVTAEQALPRFPLRSGAMAAFAAALTILICADHLETAALWADRMLAKFGERGARSWQGVLTAIRADIAYRSGQVADAQCYAEAALGMMSRDSWATVLGVPLGTVVLAYTTRGQLAEARRELDQPVPESMFQTVWGLYYLRARGSYYLATGRAEAALNDFSTCGDLMACWNLDLPALVPWRIHAAHAHVALGQPEHARALAESQLTQLGPEPNRTKAAALRVLAAVAPLAQRPTLLREAAEILRACGDRLELAHTLADLSQAQRSLGDLHRARITLRRACDLATECQADALRRRLLPEVDDEVLDAADEMVTEAFNSLSDAERRVAALAAQGSTNRQIANKLFVTVSTVEQHLTKVYRKLNVTRRTDLLAKLGSRVVNVA